MNAFEKPEDRPIRETPPVGASEKSGRRPDDRAQNVTDRIEERILRAKAAHDAHEQRARERLEFKFERARSTVDTHRQRLGGRERILNAAKTLFLDKGYVPTSMQEIADAASLRKASIYHHFKDKEALFSEIVLDEFTISSNKLRAIIAAGGPLADSLFELASAQLEMTSSDSGRLFLEFQKHVPEERHEEVHAILKTWVDEFAIIFENAIARQEIAPIDPRVAALFFFQMGAAWTFHGMDDPSLLPPDPATGARTIVNVILNGLRSGLASAEG